MIPVVLFAYARPDHLRQTLACLRENHVPLVYAFSDGPRTPDEALVVADVRGLLRDIDWCEVVLCERDTNLGLGRSILTGVTEVLSQHEMCLVFEDDLVCVPGTYAYLSAALEHYQNDSRVMSVTGWTHPRVTPDDVHDRPYFDGRAECWVWGTWSRAWEGMVVDARTLMMLCAEKGIPGAKYGGDLPPMAEEELRRNTWAVRFIFHHLLNDGLCLRPPWSMVEHVGFGAMATNAGNAVEWANPPLQTCPPLLADWPLPVEHPACPLLWQIACPPWPAESSAVTTPKSAPSIKRALQVAAMGLSGAMRLEKTFPSRTIQLLSTPLARKLSRAIRPERPVAEYSSSSLRLSGDYASWDAAMEDCTGYDAEVILDKTIAALLKVKRGDAVFERDSVLFDEIQYAWPLLAGLLWVAARCSGSLNVLDFGGSLGSTFFQNRAFLAGLSKVRWNIVEQPRQVEVGRRWFEDDQLRFYGSVEECLAETQPQVVLLSSVLQYLPEPAQIMEMIQEVGSAHLIVDRTPFWNGPSDRLCVQHVPAEIYPASYPSWVFSSELFHSGLKNYWDIVAEFDDPDWLPAPVDVAYRGLIAVRREPV